MRVLLAWAWLGLREARAAGDWPSEPPSWPKYPGRQVKVLNGTWDFSFLGDVVLNAKLLVEAAPMEPVVVPDAFDMRPDSPRCSTCWAKKGTDEDDEELCGHCCSRAYGWQGNQQCWQMLPEADREVAFEHCCNQHGLRHRRGVARYEAQVQEKKKKPKMPQLTTCLLNFCPIVQLPSSQIGEDAQNADVWETCGGFSKESFPVNLAASVLCGPNTAVNTSGALLFGACALRCLVAVDGVVVADHSGLSPFSVPVASADRELRSITVLVDNRFDHISHPVHQLKYDWYQGGGLLRAVQFHSLASQHLAYLAGVEVFPRTLEHVDVDVRTFTADPAPQSLEYRWKFDDPQEGCDWGGWSPIIVGSGTHNVSVPNARSWSPEKPDLHRLKVALLSSLAGDTRKLLDCVEVRFGLRHVSTSGRDILLNGQPLKLFGFNRHDLTASPVLSHEELARDVRILREVGANFVRGAHYAQDQRFLDLCDENGLLVWEEVLGWQNTPKDFADGIFMMQSLKLADEMAAASVNHPSVIFFGFFNEGRSDDPSPATEAAYRGMASRLRERSRGTRLISWGSSTTIGDRYLRFADVCSFHHYPAWYPTTAPGDLEEVKGIPLIWEAYANFVEENFPSKPLLITEAGAGGLFGHHGPTEEKWTEEFQSLLMQMHYVSVFTNPKIAGLALWQFADIPIDRLVSDDEQRPRGLNNKGVVSLSRLPKLSFQALRLLRNSKPGQYFGLILPPQDADRLTGLFKV
ncbi:uidA [Symbiodinium natans]|uniref:UidA protein n=1 Tax=Symbiodinium natans TaxID=878477 RepID=A0A812V4R7_9DINO|nr:uidA [Symbiodinium natans]